MRHNVVNDYAWTLFVLSKVTYHPAIADAIDEDGSGFISIHEINSFIQGRPKKWSVDQWLTFDRPRSKALRLQGLNKGLAKALGIFGRKFRPWPSLRASLSDSVPWTMVENPLWDYFWRGAKQNSSMYMSYCKGCVAVELEKTGATASTLTQDTAAFKAEATAEATLQKTGSGSSQKRQRTESNSTPADVSEPPPKKKQSTLTGLTFRRNDMPFGAEEKAVFQKQALRAIVSSGAPLQLFEDPEMKILFGMLRTTAPGIIPTAKVVGGRLLDAEAAEVEEKIGKVMKGKVLGLSYAYLLELINVTAENKDGPSQCDHFAEMIDRVELKYGCFVIYFTTDADGGSKKGRILLGKKRPWLILPSCWAHQFQLILGNYFKVNDTAAVIAEDATGLIAWLNNHSKVRVIFNEAQRTIQVSSGAVKIIILAYLVANLP
ncbi:hypothetical protein B0H10DRAFT_1953978 [Mycena sp. CBHHK59/15]|nr:hypothetical protein B0H10DRAFT_1953978 [Mycena sp. CBHHK59/15]